MKTYEEMMDDLFRRRDEYNRQRKQRNKTYVKIGSVAACCTVIVLTVYAIPSLKSSNGIGNLPLAVSTEDVCVSDFANVVPSTGSTSANQAEAKTLTHYTINDRVYWLAGTDNYASKVPSGYEYAGPIGGETNNTSLRGGTAYTKSSEPWRAYVQYEDAPGQYYSFVVHELLHSYISYNRNLYMQATDFPVKSSEALMFLPMSYTSLNTEGILTLPESYYAKDTFGLWVTECPSGYKKVGTLKFQEAGAYPETNFGTNNEQFSGCELYADSTDEIVYVFDGGNFYYTYIMIAK